eukprot:3304314-Rhodomonas_salina.1
MLQFNPFLSCWYTLPGGVLSFWNSVRTGTYRDVPGPYREPGYRVPGRFVLQQPHSRLVTNILLPYNYLETTVRFLQSPRYQFVLLNFDKAAQRSLWISAQQQLPSSSVKLLWSDTARDHQLS